MLSTKITVKLHYVLLNKRNSLMTISPFCNNFYLSVLEKIPSNFPGENYDDLSRPFRPGKLTSCAVQAEVNDRSTTFAI